MLRDILGDSSYLNLQVLKMLKIRNLLLVVPAIFSVLVCSSLAFAVSDSTKFETYQRVKNITANDDPAGSAYTLGSPSNELRHLVVIHNTDNYEHDYDVSVELPPFLELRERSTQIYRNDWHQSANITHGISVRLVPFETVYIRFTTHISKKFPNENQILTTLSRVTADTRHEKLATTKIYVPNFTSRKALPIEQELSAREQERVRKLLEEEKHYMEDQFKKLVESRSKPIDESALLGALGDKSGQSEKVKNKEKNAIIERDYSSLILLAGAILLLIGYHHVRKK